MKMKALLPLLVWVALTPGTWSDTFTLNTGICVDGKIVEQDKDHVVVDAGGNRMVYRTEEVLGIEANDRTGELDLKKIEEEVAKEDARFRADTGVSLRQHARIQELLEQTLSEDPETVKAAIKALVDLNAEVPLLPYFKRILPEYSPKLIPVVLSVAAKIDLKGAWPFLIQYSQSPEAPCRIQALALFGKTEDPQALELIARGLADPNAEVRVAAAQAAGVAASKDFTPMLMANFPTGDQWIVNACEKALQVIWAVERPLDQGDRDSFWGGVWSKNPTPSAYKPSEIRPLADETKKFIDE